MKKTFGLRILAGLVLLAAIAGIAFFAYQAGMDHSSAGRRLRHLRADTAPAPYPYYYGWPWHPFPFFSPLAASCL